MDRIIALVFTIALIVFIILLPKFSNNSDKITSIDMTLMRDDSEKHLLLKLNQEIIKSEGSQNDTDMVVNNIEVLDTKKIKITLIGKKDKELKDIIEYTPLHVTIKKAGLSINLW